VLIKKPHNRKIYSTIIRVFYWRKYFIYFVLVLSIFLSGVFYGIRGYKTGLLSYYFKQVKGAVFTNIDTGLNFIHSLTVNPDILYVDIKAINLEKLSYLRQMALDGNGIIPEEIKDSKVPGKIRYKNNKYKANFSLTGQNYNHIAHPYKWSFRVKIKESKTIDGMEKFTLLVPMVRGDNLLSEWIIHKFSQYLGLISLRYDFKKVIVNGKNYGIYAIEEHLDKRMIENNRLREGLIVKAGLDSLKVYKMKKVLKNEGLSSQLKYLDVAWQSFITGKINTQNLFDVTKLAKYYALSDLVNGQHTHFMGNEFYYLNPITHLLEPIGREWDSPYKKYDEYDIFINDNTLGNTDFKTTRYQNLILNDPQFVLSYLDALREFSTNTFILNFINSIEQEISTTRAILYTEYPHLTSSEDFLYDLVDKITTTLNSDIAGLLSFQLEGKISDEMVFSVNNDSKVPVIIKEISVGDETFDLNTVVPHNYYKNIHVKTMDLYDRSFDMRVTYRAGGQLQWHTKKIIAWPDNEIEIIYSTNDEIGLPYIDGSYILDQNKDKWVVDHNIVISKDTQLIISPGTTIDIVNNASIITYSNVIFKGETNNQIKVISSDGSGQGIIVISSKTKSIINNTNFIGLTNLNKKGWSQTAPIVFYESEVEISNSSFENNYSEDALNIVRSDFYLNKVLFKNNYSDALDLDYSVGSIIDSEFLNIGNDAIDISGSSIFIKNVTIQSSKDKAISMGEKSNAKGNSISIENSGIGISSKDLSKFKFDDIDITNCDVAFSLFKKKSEFGPTSGIVNNVNMKGNKVDYLIEKKSFLQINGNLIKGDINDVKSLMYGNRWGKKTAP
jgi:hypothetical protein